MEIGRDYGKRDEQDQYESVGLDDSVDDDRDLGQIALDRRAADAVLDARESRFANRKLPHLLHDNGNLETSNLMSTNCNGHTEI